MRLTRHNTQDVLRTVQLLSARCYLGRRDSSGGGSCIVVRVVVHFSPVNVNIFQEMGLQSICC